MKLLSKVVPDYPGLAAPDRIQVLGEAAVLDLPLLGVFCSIKCPGSLILQAYDAAVGLREQEICMISGFHSPLEKELLAVFLKGRPKIVHFLARNLDNIRLLSEQRKAIEAGRLVLLSATASSQRRSTEKIAQERNLLVGALAQDILIIHAEPGGHVENACQEFIRWGKCVYTLENEANLNLIANGVEPWRPTTRQSTSTL